MTFPAAVRTCLLNYAKFTGRASRSEFWWFMLFYSLVNLLCVGLDYWLFDVPLTASTGFPGMEDNHVINLQLDVGALTFVSELVLFIPSIAVGARRLHDRGHSGWMQLLWIIPVAGWIVLVIMFVMRGNDSANEYGPPPNEILPRRRSVSGFETPII